MGLSSSKHTDSLTSEPVIRRSGSTRINVLKSSCLGSNHNSLQVSDCPNAQVNKAVASSSENTTVSSNKELGETSFNDSLHRQTDTSTRDLSSRSTSRFMSRFSFIPGNLSFRLNRSNSARTSTCNVVSNNEERQVVSSDLDNNDDMPQGCDIFPALFRSNSLRTRHPRSASTNLHDNQQINDAGGNLTTDIFSPINRNDGAGDRHGDRSVAAREFAERNVRFSRTLSVGRLRDRVLRRSPVSDSSLYGFEQDGEVRNSSRVTRRGASGHATIEVTTEIDNLSQPRSYRNHPSRISLPFYDSPNIVHEDPRARETRYRDLLEHRSNFIERRRRIRSQVRALQRLGRRFQNLSGHERSCVLSNQHRTGHCTCRSAARDVNNGDDATARASISRIVMLAEALFEVLDEIHQQSVVMSSQPSLSSIGSIPAPNEVVDSLPLKIFSKLKKKSTEEAAQCYICLVEYEEGDSIRTLPCHHQFHRACVDKWLKEIHRVCPLCRGDICSQII